MASHARTPADDALSRRIWAARDKDRRGRHRPQVSPARQAGRVLMWTGVLFVCSLVFIVLVMIAAAGVVAIQQGGMQ